MVDEPQNGSPAAKAGMQPGDIITTLNGTTIKDLREFVRSGAMMAPGSSAKLDILRKGELKTITVILCELPNQQQAKASDPETPANRGVPHLGLTLAPANEVAGSRGRYGRRS